MELRKLGTRLKGSLNTKIVVGTIVGTIVITIILTSPKSWFAVAGAGKTIYTEVLGTVKKDPNPGIYSYIRGNYSTLLFSGLLGITVGLGIAYLGNKISVANDLYNSGIAITTLNARNEFLKEVVGKRLKIINDVAKILEENKDK